MPRRTSPTSSSPPRPSSSAPATPSRSAGRCSTAIEGPALVLVGDEPLLRPEPLADLLARQQTEQAACLLGTAIVPDPTGFGRILRDSAGRFLRIVEERDCTPEEKAIREVNPSCYVFELPGLWDALDQLDTSNAQGEYYLTDAPDLLQAMGRKVVALHVLEPDDILGVNTRQHLAQAHAIMQARIQDHWMTEGVSIVDPRNTYIDGRATIGRDTVIFPFTVITGTRRRSGSDCRVGPFAHLRDGTVLDDGVEVGAFVEVNRSHLEPGARAPAPGLPGRRRRSAPASTSAPARSRPTSTAGTRRGPRSAPRPSIGCGRDPGRPGHDRRRGDRRGRTPS